MMQPKASPSVFQMSVWAVGTREWKKRSHRLSKWLASTMHQAQSFLEEKGTSVGIWLKLSELCLMLSGKSWWWTILLRICLKMKAGIKANSSIENSMNGCKLSLTSRWSEGTIYRHRKYLSQLQTMTKVKTACLQQKNQNLTIRLIQDPVPALW